MEFLHKRVHVGYRQAVEVEISIAANVMLVTDSNFSKFKSGKAYHYYGGYYKQSPVVIVPPQSGYYNVVIDLGGRPGRLRHSISVIDN